MALEDAIAKLTAALESNTLILTKLATGGSATTGKPATAPAAAPAAAPATGGKGKKDQPAAPKEMSEDEFRKEFGGFLGVTDAKLKETRKSQVAAILAHFGVGRATEIPADKRIEAVGYLKVLLAGQTPEFMAEEASDDDGDALL